MGSDVNDDDNVPIPGPVDPPGPGGAVLDIGNLDGLLACPQPLHSMGPERRIVRPMFLESINRRLHLFPLLGPLFERLRKVVTGRTGIANFVVVGGHVKEIGSEVEVHDTAVEKVVDALTENGQNLGVADDGQGFIVKLVTVDVRDATARILAAEQLALLVATKHVGGLGGE